MRKPRWARARALGLRLPQDDTAPGLLIQGGDEMGMGLEFECIPIEKDEGTSAILGHAGFIKTVEDLYEAMLCSVPGVKFGIAFPEASDPCLVRSEGNDEDLRAQAERSLLKIAAGHTFLILFTGAYPINVITNVRNVSEVAAIYCAFAAIS